MEMRWLEVRTPDGIAPDGSSSAVHVERKLQYRNWDSSGGLTTTGPGWCKWQDVPTVVVSAA